MPAETRFNHKMFQFHETDSSETSVKVAYWTFGETNENVICMAGAEFS